MTTIDTGATPRMTAALPAPRFSRLVARISEAWTLRAERRETYHALSHLTDHELDDIGLTRADIDAMR